MKPSRTAGKPSKPNPAHTGKWAVPVICILLAAMVCGVFGQTLWHDFVNYDDNVYVFENPHVASGLSFKAVFWAFRHPDLYLWTPLTTISHMLDCQLYGLQPWGHHLTNVLLHGTAAILLFLVLRQMTGATWRSAFVAAVFAVHPLRAESVAWVAERKDVLSGVFFMLTLWAYVLYVRRRSVARHVAVVALFVFGLMAKQMAVTLPFLLLLLDYWPLGRLERRAQFVPLLKEKIPLFALSFASCAQTLLIGSDLRKLVHVTHPLLLRTGNALVCYIVYIFQMFHPVNLAVFYPYPAAVPAWEALGALALLAGISIAAFALRKKHPAFLTGWFWYLGMLVTVIGVVPVGKEGHADRYTYLPQIGLYIAITWVCADACSRLRIPRLLQGVAMSAVVATLAICAFTQTSYWKNDETLWGHTLDVMPDNAFAHNNLGLDLESDGDTEQAIAHYWKALAIQPDYQEAHNNMGNALFDKGDMQGAIAQYKAALDINPIYPDAHNNMGHALLQNRQLDEAIAEFQKALAIDPDFAVALNNLGNAFSAKGATDNATVEYRKAIDIKPDYADAHSNLANTLLIAGKLEEAAIEYKKALGISPDLVNARCNLANILLQEGQAGEAIADFQIALKIQPHDPEIQNNLARVLATYPDASLRNGALALELAQEANQTTGGHNPIVLGNLASAYAETGQFSTAVRTAQRALELVDSPSDAKLADMLRAQIALYQAGTPFRDKHLLKTK